MYRDSGFPAKYWIFFQDVKIFFKTHNCMITHSSQHPPSPNSWVASPSIANTWVAIANNWVAIANNWVKATNNWVETANNWVGTAYNWVAAATKWVETANKWVETANNWVETANNSIELSITEKKLSTVYNWANVINKREVTYIHWEKKNCSQLSANKYVEVAFNYRKRKSLFKTMSKLRKLH